MPILHFINSENIRSVCLGSAYVNREIPTLVYSSFIFVSVTKNVDQKAKATDESQALANRHKGIVVVAFSIS